jgi:IK cytokine
MKYFIFFTAAAVAKVAAISDAMQRKGALLDKLAAEPEGYAECYPGLDEMQDAIDDSDDEVDYTKMDLGNKKGPIGRWDFDTPEEYSEYMNNKEALPKAAFQYGVKMADGRRTRKYNKEKNEKAELDREWQKIQNIMNKRKPTSNDGVPEFKIPRY